MCVCGGGAFPLLPPGSLEIGDRSLREGSETGVLGVLV